MWYILYQILVETKIIRNAPILYPYLWHIRIAWIFQTALGPSEKAKTLAPGPVNGCNCTDQSYRGQKNCSKKLKPAPRNFFKTHSTLIIMTSQIEEPSTHSRQITDKSKDFLCKICLSSWPAHKAVKLDKCECLFCTECLECYVEHAITDGNVLSIPCPDGNCTTKENLTDNQISQIIGDNTFTQYTRLKRIKEIAVDKSQTFCPVPGCDGVCNGLPGQPSNCKQCGFTFCFQCKEPWHPDKMCQKEKTNIDAPAGLRFIDILNMGETSEIKSCPLCSVLIQRDAGCAQMMCGNCKHMFCWHCKKSLDNDLLLRHYDKGPCRNKLGHSRATLFLHRTQVVAGFVFFGAMIIVASPFLLLISPCLLLSKLLHNSDKHQQS